MPVKLNLLPPELAVDKNLSAALKLTRSLGIIFLAVFILFVFGISSFFIYDSVILKNLTGDVDSLTNQINLQNASEQQVVLLKDRLNKITSVQLTPSSLPNLIVIDPFLSSLSSTTAVSELGIDSQKMDLTLNFKSNSDLSTFLKSLSSSDVFKAVTITSFGLNPSTGYSVGIDIQTK